MSRGPTLGRRWRRAIPVVFVTYSLAYLDRVNYGLAAAAGMAGDLRITPAVSSLAAALFFAAYFLFQIPGAVYAERRSVKKLVFGCLLAWGALAALTGCVDRIWELLLVRFLLGVAEAAVMPAMIIYLSRWFGRAERSRANTFLILGNPVTIVWMSVLSGYIAHSLGWRWMFVLEGVPSVIWAFAWWGLADDFPAKAGWLAEDEKQRLGGMLALEQLALPPVRNYRAAFGSRPVQFLCAQYFCWSLGLYGFVLWLPSILRHASQVGMVGTGWLSALPYAAAVPAMLAASLVSDRRRDRRTFVWPFLLAAGIAFYGSFALGTSHAGLSYALLVVAGIGMYAPYGPFFAIVPEMLPSNVAGGAVALINSSGALGGFCGSYLVGYLDSLTGSASASYLLMSASLVASALLTVLSVPRGPAAAQSPGAVPQP
ncbi:MAG TPA: MFS transporter [Opitutaceae bacterium]|jgi:MFS family permease